MFWVSLILIVSCTYSFVLLHNFIASYCTIDRLSYWVWHCITSFIDYTVQIYIGQKDKANQWKVTVLEEFLHTLLLYQAITVRIINVLAVL